MGIRNSVIRRKRRLNRHTTPLSKRRSKVRWLLAQRTRVRNYRRFFSRPTESSSSPQPESNTDSNESNPS